MTYLQIKNLPQLLRRANDTTDPRCVFYQAVLTASTVEEYISEVGDVVVVPPTYPEPMGALREFKYMRDNRGWIAELPESPDASSATTANGDFCPDPALDARRRTIRAIITRQGQAKFRSELLQAYGERCAVTGCAVQQLLEAAHITPYLGEHTNVVSNGLLLRADIHILWDVGLLAVHPTARTVHVAAKVSSCDAGLAALEGTVLRPPTPEDHRPSEASLRAQWDFFRSMSD